MSEASAVAQSGNVNIAGKDSIWPVALIVGVVIVLAVWFGNRK